MTRTHASLPTLMMMLAGLASMVVIVGPVALAATAADDVTAPAIPRHPEPKRVAGWTKDAPPDWTAPKSGHRSHVFTRGQAVVFELGAAAVTYEVRDYWGELVDSGAASASTTIKAAQPGWYKLYVYGKESRPAWGDIVGATTFVIVRDHQGFPALPDASVSNGYYPSMDQPMRAFLGMGPQRHFIGDSAKADEAISHMEADIAYDAKEYLPRDPARKRELMIAFPNGTADLKGVKAAAEHFKKTVHYWEPRNEPNFGSSGADFAVKEMKPFHDAVKSADPSLKVMGPGTVTIGPGLLPWLEDFFRAGGGASIDVFSFHAYNNINGDLWLARTSLDALQALLKRHGVGGIEKWQTEQGFMAAIYGSYQPRLNGRWTMLELMVFEQYGIPKEHNHLWYDISHGFWDCPCFWENDDRSLNPAAPLIRVWSEELFGTTFAKRLDFGKDGEQLYVGSRFDGADRSVVALMNAGCGVASVPVSVTGAKSLTVVSAFGVESQVSVVDGVATLQVPELPLYVELAKGQDLTPVSMDWGTNLARQPGVAVTSSGSGKHPIDKGIPNSIDKLTNGVLENWYYTQQAPDQPWMDDTPSFPAWVEFDLPKAQQISRVVVYAAPPWQWQGTIIDHEIQYERDGAWVSVDRVVEPTKTFGSFSAATRTTVDSFFADRWIFEHRFAPVTASKLRLLVHDVTCGGGATPIILEAGGQAGPRHLMLREVGIYGPEPVAAMRSRVSDAVKGGEGKGARALTVSLRNNGAQSLKASLSVVAPSGWSVVPAQSAVALAAHADTTVSFELKSGDVVSAGSASVAVELKVDGVVINSDAASFTVDPVVAVKPRDPDHLDKGEQALPADVTNSTAKAVQGTLSVEAVEIGGAHRTVAASMPFGPLEPGASALVPITLKGIELGSGRWQVSYKALADHVATVTIHDYAVREWLAVGPFARDFAKDFGPEAVALDPIATYPGITGAACAWKTVRSESNGLVDLGKAFDPHDNVCAYAALWVKSPTACASYLSAGSDDGVKIWLNRKEVVADDANRGAAPGQDRANVNLVAGWNEVLVKVTQGGYGWGFYFDLLSLDGRPMAELTYSTTKP